MAWPRVDFHAGPFLGMRYISQPENWDHQYVYHAQDAFPTPEGGYGPRSATAAVQVSAVSASATVQGGHLFRTNDGTIREMLAINGELWRRTAGAFTKDVSTTNLTSATITLNNTGRVYLDTFNNQLVVSDGTNTPFTWDGTVSAGLTKLSNAPVAYGPPTVYYAKLFFVKNTERDTIVWSEENAANTGYEAGGFNNAWSLRQSGAGPIHRILGRNDALYYWRSGSIGTIHGAVNTDFTTAGVHDDVSREVGSTAPESVVDYHGYIWFVDKAGRPHRFAPGGVLEPVWQQVAALFPGGGTDVTPGSGAYTTRAFALTPSDIALTLAAPLPLHQCVVFGWSPSGTAFYTQRYAFDAISGRALCKLVNTSTVADVQHLGAGIGTGVISGTIDDFPCLTVAGNFSNQTWVTTFGDPSQGVALTTNTVPAYITGPFAAPQGAMLQADRLRAQFFMGPSTATVSVVATVFDSGKYGDAGSALPGAAVLAGLQSAPSTRVATWGLHRRARWLQFLLSAGTTAIGPQVAVLTGVDVSGAVLPLHPKVTT